MHMKYFHLLVPLLLYKTIECRRYAKLTSILCEVLDDTYINITLCEMKAIQRDIVEVSAYCKLLKKPVNNATIYFDVKKRGFEHSPPIVKYTIDACAFMRNSVRNPLAELFMTSLGLQKYSNVNHTCPYDHDLIFNKHKVNEQSLPMLPLPLGRYRLYTLWSAYNVPRGSFTVSFQLYDRD